MDQWPAGGPKLVWKADLSPGASSPVIAGRHVYCTAMEKSQAVLVCFDRDSGQRCWAVSFGPEGKSLTTIRQEPYSTPTVDGDRVYVMTGGGRVACISTTTRSVLWAHDCKDLDCVCAGWGTSSSFLIVGDVALVNMIAFDKLKGIVLWKNIVNTSEKRSGKIDHASPTLLTIDGKQQVVSTLVGESSPSIP